MAQDARYRSRIVALVAFFMLVFVNPSKLLANDPVFGPETCLRGTGAPTVFNFSFASAEPSRGYIFKVYNGGLEDATYELVSSSTITLNGTEILGPSNFNQSVAVLEVPVTLQPQNSLSVEVRGKPGGAMILKVYPFVVLDSPVGGQVFNAQPIGLSGHLNSSATAVSVNGLPATMSDTGFAVSGLTLAEGNNTIVVAATGVGGSIGTDSVEVTLDSVAPAIAIAYPTEGLTTNQTVDPLFSVTDAQDPKPTVSVVPAPPYVAEGAYQILITATDWAGNQARSTRTFTIDKTPPVISILAPQEGATVAIGAVDISGTVDDPEAALTVNGVRAARSGTSFAVEGVHLVLGPNTIVIEAHDAAGNRSSCPIHVSFVPPQPTVSLSVFPPSILEGESATLVWAAADATSVSIDQGIGVVGPSGSLGVAPSSSTTYTITATGAGGTAAASATVAVAPAGVRAELSATPEIIPLGGAATLTWSTRNATQFVIEPGIGAVAASGSLQVAPTATTRYQLTAVGDDGVAVSSVTVRVQGKPAPLPEGSFGIVYQGLVPADATLSAYDERRFAVLTGLVTDRGQAALSEVSVRVHGHPEYGTAFTNIEGRFSIPVEGGGTLTLDYRKDGYLPLQRQVEPRWNEAVAADPVVLIRHDTSSTEIALDGDPEHFFVHRSSATSDESGTRAATVVVAGDTRAFAQLESGEIELARFELRATEYDTPEAMPAVLPPSSAFTYCVDISASNLGRVRFSKPVTVYVENFLGFDVGVAVPAGYYDDESTRWIASKDGTVVALLDRDGDGSADALDATGDGLADDLDGDGAFSDEVSGLEDPVRYPPGASFWRVNVSHLTPWDFNWAWSFHVDDIPPNPFAPPFLDTQRRCDEQKPLNSSAECQGRIYQDDLPIAGTDLTLHYSSNRVDGYLTTISVPASGATVPARLQYIHVTLNIGGRVFDSILPPAANQVAEFIWDGRDYLGNPMPGTTPVIANIGFAYQPVYYATLQAFQSSFARVGGAGLFATRIQTRQIVIAWRSVDFLVQRGASIGDEFGNGWTVSSHHRLFPADPTSVYKGDGTVARQGVPIFSTVPPGIGYGDSSDACPYGLPLDFCHPMGMASDAAGNIFVADQARQRIVKIDRAGTKTTIAGNGTLGYSGDGGPATLAQLSWPAAIALDGAGNLYILEILTAWGDYGRLRKVDTQGIITTLAGLGTASHWDGPVRALDSSLHVSYVDASSMAVDRWGTIYLAEGNAVSRIATDGMIETIVKAPYVYDTRGVAVDDAGNLYVSDKKLHRVWKYDVTGRLTVFAGTGSIGYRGDGGPAVQAGIPHPKNLYVDRGGNVYISSDGWPRIRRVDVNGIISHVTGIGDMFGGTGEGTPAVTANITQPEGMTMTPDGSLYVSNRYSNVAHKIAVPGVRAASMSPGNLLYSAENGLGYVFGWNNRHLATVDLKTGASLAAFEYVPAGLRSISDRFGNAVSIERNATGVPTSVVAPDGQVTELVVDANGDLRQVRYPDGTQYTMAYGAGSLLTDKWDRRGNHFLHGFDAAGRLRSASDPEGGRWSWLQTVDLLGNVATQLASAEGDVRHYLEQPRTGGAWSSRITASDGSVSTYEISGNLLTEQSRPACRESTVRTFAADPGHRYRMPVARTQTTPAGSARQVSFARSYQDLDGDQRKELITETTRVNGRAWVTREDIVAGTSTTLSPAGRSVSASFDPATLLVAELSVPGLHPQSLTYDPRGRLTGVTQGDRTLQLAYDANGNPDFMTTADGTVDYGFDPMGRLRSELRPDGSAIDYQYDADGNLTAITNPNEVSAGFDYTANSQRRNYVQPLSGAYEYAYDRDRRLTSVTAPSGRSITNTYSLGNLASTATPEGVASYAYLCGSRLGSAARNGESLAFGYDGSLLTSDTRGGTVGGTIAYTYNNDFAPVSLTYAGATVGLGYDSDGLLTSVGGYTIGRNAQNGLPEAVSGQGMAQARTFNGYGELDGSASSVGGLSVYDWSVPVRDNAGRILQRQEIIDGSTIVWDYDYDAVGRLLEVRMDGQVVERYGYDGNGNRMSETNVRRGISAQAYGYSVEDHVLAAGPDAFQFDVDGFLQSRATPAGTTTYDYSSRGELLRVDLPGGTILTYVHDPFGRRIAKQVNGAIVEKYLWADQTTLLAVYDGSDNLLQRYTYADARVPVSMTAGGATYFLLTDQVGSLRAVADTSGNIVKRIDYDSFGNIVADTNPGFTVPFGFAGGLHDRDTGLVRFGYRDYSPELGRFVAKDPIDFAGGDTNLYAYSMSDPVNFVDPTGEVPILVPVIIGGIVGTWIWGSDANAPEGPETPLMPPQSGAEAAAAAAAGAGGGILAAEGAAAGVCMVRTAGPFIVKDPPHKGLGPHYHYGPRYPGSNHPRYHVGPRNTGAGNFTWKQWFQNGMPWRWK